MGEWKEYKLSELIKLIGGGTPKTTVPEYWDGDIPWLSVTDFNTGKKYCTDAEKRITERGLKESSTRILKKGQLIISARGTVGVVSMLGKDMAFNQSNYGIDANKELTTNNFLYYLLKDNVENFISNSYGAVFDTITKETFNQISVSIPELNEQNEISEILSSLDDKIDLLHRQIKILEQIAETLFRQWFVEEAEDDWENVRISDIIEVRDGTHDSPKQKEYGKYLITSRHLKQEGIDFSSAYYISENDYSEVNKRSKVEKYDILFSMIGTIGLIHYVDQEPDYAIKNIGLFKSSQNKEFSLFLMLLLKSPIGKKFIFEYSNGSTQEYITLGSLRNFEFHYPGENKIKVFYNIVSPNFNKIIKNKNQINTLSNIRDMLLPKLMRGDYRLKGN
ncbi:MAG: restriction endonuclease subunit S [Bacteroidetes bacterium]|nr:restriction endonuclease subunit S [Bacteroidota bacterium]